jgi:signal transduction histidine kinase
MRRGTAQLVLDVSTYCIAGTAFVYVLLRPGGARDDGWALPWTAAMLAYVAYPLLLRGYAKRQPWAFAAGQLLIAGAIAWLTRLDFVSGLLMYAAVGRAILLDTRVGVASGVAAVAIAYTVAGLVFGTSSGGIYLVLLAWTAGLAFYMAGTLLMLREQAARERSDELLRQLTSAHMQLADAHEQLRASAQRIRELATVDERNRLAREIHDSLGHYLTAANVQLEAALSLRVRDSARADRAVVEAKRLSSEALSEVRRSVSALRPGALDAQPLAAALERHIAESRLPGQPQVALEIDGDADRCGVEVELLLFRAVQEGLTNVRKHARAAHVWVELSITDAAAEVRVRDDGQGVTEQEVIGHAGSFGLAGLRERTAALGGMLSFESVPGEGAEMRVAVPLAAAPVRSSA